ncbi:MAG: hypothetical protein ACFFEM_06105, partial [Candidatus Thorarchaeota archaeon]
NRREFVYNLQANSFCRGGPPEADYNPVTGHLDASIVINVATHQNAEEATRNAFFDVLRPQVKT